MLLPPLIPQKAPTMPEVVVRLARERDRFRVEIENNCCSRYLVCKDPWAWRLEVFRGKMRISDEEAFLKGGERDGTLYHPPQMLIQSRSDWLVLKPGDRISFFKSAMDLAGVIDDRDATRATIQFLPAQAEVPEDMTSSETRVLDGTAKAEWKRYKAR